MPIDTLANIKIAIGVTGSADDSLLSQLQAAADSFVETYCARNFLGGSFTEYHAGSGPLVFLKNYPIHAVASVHVDVNREFEDESQLAPDQYVAHLERGVIECLDGSFVPALPNWNPGREAFPQAVKVVYSTTTNAVPALIARAYAELIGSWYRQIKTHVATGQLNVVQVTGETIYPVEQSSGFTIPASVKEMLNHFRVPAI